MLSRGMFRSEIVYDARFADALDQSNMKNFQRLYHWWLMQYHWHLYRISKDSIIHQLNVNSTIFILTFGSVCPFFSTSMTMDSSPAVIIIDFLIGDWLHVKTDWFALFDWFNTVEQNRSPPWTPPTTRDALRVNCFTCGVFCKDPRPVGSSDFYGICIFVYTV